MGVQQGANVLVDGRGREVDGFRDGYFLHPTVMDEVQPGSEFAHTEIFGPVLSMMHANTVEEAIEIVNARKFGNQACLFTSSGAAARQFRYAVRAGNVGINLGVAAPMADAIATVVGTSMTSSREELVTKDYLKAELAAVRTEIATAKNDTIRWLIGSQVILIVALAALMNLMKAMH